MPTAGDDRERSPHPYARRGRRVKSEESSGYDARQTPTTLSSESGTEADDERPTQYLKALPPPSIRPAKGLRQLGDDGTEGSPTPLLTPSQLDSQSRRLSEGYFDHKLSQTAAQQAEEDELLVARRLFEKRRRAEHIRRISEGALLAAIGLIIILAPAVTSALWNWHRGTFNSHMCMIQALMLCSRTFLPIGHCCSPDFRIPPEDRDILSFRRYQPSQMAPLSRSRLLRPCFDPVSYLCPRPNRPFSATAIPRSATTESDLGSGISSTTSLPSSFSPQGHQHTTLDCLHHSTNLL